MQITIDLPEALQQTLIDQATQNQTTPEQLIIQLLTQNLIPTTPSHDLANDPLFQLAGSITSNIPDLAENHDDYIGQALYQEMYRDDE